MTTRKYMYLVTEHDERPELVGTIQFTDVQLSRPLKNEEGDVTIFDGGSYRVVGRKVGMGYHDFEDEDAFDDADHVKDVIEQKLSEVDEKWLRKADIDD